MGIRGGAESFTEEDWQKEGTREVWSTTRVRPCEIYYRKSHEHTRQEEGIGTQESRRLSKEEKMNSKSVMNYSTKHIC